MYCICGAGCWRVWFVQSDYRCKIADLDIVGTRSGIEQSQLEQHIRPIIKENYFTSDLEQIRDKALEISWVDRVVVSRAWPNSIRVRIMPRHPIARWGTGRLLSDSGDVYAEAELKTIQIYRCYMGQSPSRRP